MNPRRRDTGLTLVELLIVVALVAIVLGLAAPSFNDFIKVQRLRGVNAQLVTDIQFARSESVSRNVPMHMRFLANGTMSCYMVYTAPNTSTTCDCLAAEGSRCSAAGTAEVRTVQLPLERGVRISQSNHADHFSFDPRTGGIKILAVDTEGGPPSEYNVEAWLDSRRKLRDVIGVAGRLKVCSPAGTTMGQPAC